MSRRTRTLAVGTVLVVLLAFAVMHIRVPYVALGPGPTVNTLGSFAGKKVITVTGGTTRNPTGHLNLTTVSVTEDFDLLTAMRYWVDGDYTVVPREIVYPPNQTQQQTDKQNAQQFTQSQNSAETAALRDVGYPVHVVVATLSAASPSRGKLAQGDEITSISGARVTSVERLQSLVGKQKPGATVTVGYRRGTRSESVRVRTGTAPDDSHRAVLGVSVKQNQPHPGISISFDIDKIGGPSAGLMFALGIIDLLEPTDLTGGKFVAGTGEIDDDGAVSPIGGIHQKTVAARAKGATIFLTPAANCGEAMTDLPHGLRLVKVTSLDGALAALKAVRTGNGSLPACTR